MTDYSRNLPTPAELTTEQERNHLRELLRERDREVTYLKGLTSQLRDHRDRLVRLGTELVALPTGEAFDKLQIAITQIREDELTWKA